MNTSVCCGSWCRFVVPFRWGRYAGVDGDADADDDDMESCERYVRATNTRAAKRGVRVGLTDRHTEQLFLKRTETAERRQTHAKEQPHAKR